MLDNIFLQVEQCPEDPSEWNQVIGIYPVGLRESLIIDLEMLCMCQCEWPGNEVSESIYQTVLQKMRI